MPTTRRKGRSTGGAPSRTNEASTPSKSRGAGAAGDQSSAGRSSGIKLDDVHTSLGGSSILNGVDLVTAPGSSLSILGPSGCGKTTLLRVIAGLQPVSKGTVSVGNRVVDSDATWVRPEQRGVGMVFQDWALFPHLTVAQNVSFGLPRNARPGRRRNRDRSRQYILENLEMVGLADLADRLPGSLSGGQQQRVALARALAPHPSVLLLDEPFSNLDTSLRVEVRTEVASLLSDLEVTSIFVTHDQDEAFVLGDQVAVMRDGNVVQKGSAAELYASPVDPWLAGFVGEADFVDGRAAGSTAETRLGSLPLTSPKQGSVKVLLRPEELRLASGSEAEISFIEYYGHDTLYFVEFPDGAQVRVRDIGAPAYEVGHGVKVVHSGVAASAFDVTETSSLVKHP